MDRTLLVVEDDPAIASGLRDFLESENYQVQICADGESAVDVALRIRPDLVLLDVSLPRLGGVDVCRRLREKGFSSPVVMLTSRAELLDKVVGLEAGADDYLTKPFELRELLARIRAHTRRGDAAPQPAGTVDGNGLRRRLMAILFSDIEGYSRLMHEDETLGIDMLRRHNDIMNTCVERHGGRVVEVVGDAYLVAFESAVAAVECGVDAQRQLRAAVAGSPIGVRIGVHVGDVIELDGGVKGDAINLAKRIQEAAQQGSVTVSDTVFTIVRARMPGRFTSLGECLMKNIDDPVQLYSITP